MAYVETILGIHFFVTLYAAMGMCMGDLWKYHRENAHTRMTAHAQITWERWLLGFDWGSNDAMFVFKIYFFCLELEVFFKPNSGASR